MGNKINLASVGDAIIIRRGRGMRPSGDRYVYDISESSDPDSYIVHNTGIIAVHREGLGHNLAPGESEEGGRFKVDRTRL